MNDVNWKPVFKYLDKQFGEIKTDITALNNQTDDLLSSVGSLVELVRAFQKKHAG